MSTVSFKSVGTAYTADAVIDPTSANRLFTNEGATAAVKITLPPALVGNSFVACVKAAYELRMDPYGSEKISAADGSAMGNAGKYLGADAVGETIIAHCFKDGEWTVVAYRGTWTAEA